MAHSEECEKYRNKILRAQAAYLDEWPNYCRECNGVGSITHYQSVPYGSGSVSMPITDPCACVEDGFCPRCKFYSSDPEAPHLLGDKPCPNCGLNMNTDSGLPDFDNILDCICDENKIMED